MNSRTRARKCGQTQKQQIETTQHKSNIYRRDGDKSETK